jgi:DNA polymerase-3 subunit gamma/tau
MNPVRCANCRLSLPQNWAGMNDPNGKCPYCGKPFAVAAAPTVVPTSAQPAPRPAGPAKTMLWGAGAAIPGMPKAPVVAPAPAPAPVVANEPIAPPPERDYAPIPSASVQAGASAANAAPFQAGSSDVDVERPTEPARMPSKANQPAPTVMFESAIHPAPKRQDFDLPDSEPGADDQGAPNAYVDPEPSAESSPRPTPARLKAKSKPQPKKGGKPRSSMPAWRGVEGEETSKSKEGSSKKGIIIAVSAVVLVAIIVVGALAMRPKSKVDGATSEPAKAAPEPTPTEPAATEEPAGLAAKPAPAEAVPPTPAPKPAPAEPAAKEAAAHVEKPAHEGRGIAEKPARVEKTPEKGTSAAAEPAPEKHEPKGKWPSEEDLRRANEAYQRGNTQMFQGNTAGAIAEFNQALRLNPKDPSIHRGLGLAYAQLNNSAEAVKHLRLYLKAAPKANDRAIIEKRIEQLR